MTSYFHRDSTAAPVPKMVTTWAFAVRKDGKWTVRSEDTKAEAKNMRQMWISDGYTCGPIVKIQVPRSA